MKCPTCGAADLVVDTRDLPYIYKGKTTILPMVTGEWCPACNESILGPEEVQRTMVLMGEFIKQVNAALAPAEFIARVRCKLNIDQREASAIFGGGINAFSRYELGKTKPPLALVKLLEVLDRHPDLFAEVRQSH